MTVFILERVPPQLRGATSRWLVEPKSGVFVGRLSAMVRERLWRMVEGQLADVGAAMMIHPAANEQGFKVVQLGDSSREPIDYDGFTLFRRSS